MKRLTLFAALCCAAWVVSMLLGTLPPVEAQTSTACVTTGLCGNSQTPGPNLGTGWTNTPDGLPLTFNALYGVASMYVSFNTVAGTNDVIGFLTCDSNTSGATIASGGACGSNNVVCSSGPITPMTGTNTITFTGCTIPSTTPRYWVRWNTNNASIAFNGTATGSPQHTWEGSATCCTLPTTDTGTQADDAAAGILGVTLTAAAGGAAHHGRPILISFLRPGE